MARRSVRRNQSKGYRRSCLRIEHLERRELLTAAPGTFALYTGDLTAPFEQAMIALQINSDDFVLGGNGSALIGFALRPGEGSELDPGLIDVSPGGGGPSKPDTSGSANSLTLAELGFGDYEVTLRAEHGTIGAYELDVFLAGDANGDFQVNTEDLDAISMLKGVKLHDRNYLVSADVDRNGVINGGDLQRAQGNLGVSTQLRIENPNPLDQFLLDPGALSLVGASANTFNNRSAPLQFSLVGAEFYQNPDDVKLTVNGNPVPSAKLTVTPETITATSVLVNGKNDVSFSAVDTVGRPLYLNTTLWAGVSILRVNLVDESGVPFLEEATVVASLSDDQYVSVESTSSSGFVEFQNVPFRTILIQATASGNRSGYAGVIGTQGTVQVQLVGFNEPSAIDNNDFSQGTAGWEIGLSPVQVLPHVEGPSPGGSLFAASIVDNDLTLTTTNEGEESISRTFNTEQGTTAVRIRYRFITSEVPGGYFGSQFNDYFRVSLRSQQGGGFSGENNSMNGLGLGAFDYASGATGWREVMLEVSPQGDTIQVDAGVANVGDGAYDSQVVIDFVEEIKDQVQPSLAWDNTQGGMDLSFTVENGALAQDTTIEVYWANGTGYNDRLGAPLFTYVVPAGTAEGQHGPIQVDGNLLGNDPAGVTYLIAVASETSVGALQDVAVSYGTNANAAVVNPALVNAIKDAMRAAGQANATITSTARSPADQARAMFNNLTNSNHTIQENIATQLGIYAPPGDAVINTFSNEVQGLTRQEVLANETAIRAAMEQEIINQGPSSVSRHCADPPGDVVDVSSGAFNANNAPLFEAAIDALVSNFIDERSTNGCYHLEL